VSSNPPANAHGIRIWWDPGGGRGGSRGGVVEVEAGSVGPDGSVGCRSVRLGLVLGGGRVEMDRRRAPDRFTGPPPEDTPLDPVRQPPLYGTGTPAAP